MLPDSFIHRNLYRVRSVRTPSRCFQVAEIYTRSTSSSTVHRMSNVGIRNASFLGHIPDELTRYHAGQYYY